MIRNLLLILLFFPATLLATSYTWNGGTSTDWNTAANWTPSGVPTSVDNVTIVSGTNQPLLDQARTITNLTVTSGTLDLNTYTLTVNGTGSCSGGNVNNGTVSFAGTTVTYSGTTFGAKVTANCTNIYFNGSVFNGVVNATKTGSTTCTSNGGNKFNDSLIVSNTGTGNLAFANTTADTCNGTTDFSNSSTNVLYLSYGTSGNVFAGKTTFTNSSIGNISICFAASSSVIFNGKAVFNASNGIIHTAYNSGSSSVTFNDSAFFNNTGGTIYTGHTGTTTFNGHISLTSTAGTTYLGYNGSASLASGKTVTVGSGGFTAGNVQFKNFTQNGTTAQSLTLTSSGACYFSTGSTFNGILTLSAPAVYFNGTTFNKKVDVTKTGGGTATSNGGNKFNDSLIVTNSGTGTMYFANTNPDTCNSVAEFTNSSTNLITVGYNTSGNVFNGKTSFTNTGIGNINVGQTASSRVTFNAKTTFNNNSTGLIYVSYSASGSITTFNDTADFNNTSTGTIYTGHTGTTTYNNHVVVSSTTGGSIYLGYNGSASLASGKNIVIGSGGFSAGSLRFQNFTQNGSTAQSITLTGTGILRFGSGSTFNGNVTGTAPRLMLDGTTFNGTATFEKNGATNDISTGGNVFNNTTSIKNSSSAYLLLSNSSADDFNGNVTFIKTGSGALYPAYTGTSTFAANVTITGAVTFNGSTGTVNLDGASAQTVSGDNDFTFYNLTLSNAGVKTFSRKATVTNVLAMGTSVLSEGTSEMILTNMSASGALTRTTGYAMTSTSGMLTRKMNTTSAYIFPLAVNTYFIDSFLVNISPGNTSTQQFSIGQENSQGVKISFDQSVYSGAAETVTMTVKKNIFTLEMQFDINASENIANVKVKENGSYVALNTNLYTASGPSLTLPSINNIINFYVPYSVPADTSRNWTHSISYSEAGATTGESIQFFDALGRPEQSQVKNLSAGVALTSNVLYDTYGRAALQTLPAPTDADLKFKNLFITNTETQNYKYSDFDGSTTLNNPNLIESSAKGTLGWYYSNNNTFESYQAVTNYPYIRSEFTSDPMSDVKRSASAGDEMRMGMNHEGRVFTMNSGNELKYIFGTDSSYKVIITDTTADRLASKALAVTGGNNAIKTISVDAQKKEIVTYTCGGQVVASCVSGLTNSCTTQSVTDTMVYGGTRSIDIHLPGAKKSTLKFPKIIFFNGEVQDTVQDSEITYTITDLDSNKVLTRGTHYTFTWSTGVVAFLGSYADSSGFFRISFSYTASFLSSISVSPPDAKVDYELDYSRWSLNYYDLAGNLRKSISPKASNCATPGSGVVMSTTFDYSPLGQLIARKSPDEGKTEFLYDAEGKMRFSQNAEQAAAAQPRFTFAVYDKHGRETETGEYAYPNSGYGMKFQNYYTLPNISANDTSVHSVLEQQDGIYDTRCSRQAYMYYYPVADTNEYIPWNYTYRDKYKQKYQYMCGKIAKTKNANNATWYSYDDFGRMQYTVQRILENDFASEKTDINDQIKTIDYTYDFSGNLSKEEYQRNKNNEDFTHYYSYDSDLRLNNVETSTDSGVSKKQQVKNTFYLTGELKRSEIGSNIQGVDYVYTINGQLKSINHPSLDSLKDPGRDGVVSGKPDLFAYGLDYYQNDYTRNSTSIVSSCSSSTDGYYNGLVKAARWKIKSKNKIVSPGTELYPNDSLAHELTYRYTYDDIYQLAKAEFGIYKTSTSTFTSRSEYKVWGGQSSDSIKYDLNGNIQKMMRNAYLNNGTYNMDSLFYTYTGNTNKLASIIDSTTVGDGVYGIDIDAATSKNFYYNNLGQMTADSAEKIKEIKYTHSGQVERIVLSPNNDTIWYSYNEREQRIKSKFKNAASGKSKFTWYVTDLGGSIIAIYEKDQAAVPASDTVIKLSQIPMYDVVRIGVFNVKDSTYVYEINDPLGNPRVSFRDSSGYAAMVSWADYYPHGGLMPGRYESDYRFKYQGNEGVDTKDGWQAFELRQHNSDLGRWMAPDPNAQFYSPYLSMGNNPVSMIDPDGGYCPDCTFWDNIRNGVNRVLASVGIIDKKRDRHFGPPDNSASAAGEDLGEETGFDEGNSDNNTGSIPNGNLGVFSSPESGPGQSTTSGKFNSAPGSSGSNSSVRGYQNPHPMSDTQKEEARRQKQTHELLVAETWKQPTPPGEKQGGLNNKKGGYVYYVLQDNPANPKGAGHSLVYFPPSDDGGDIAYEANHRNNGNRRTGGGVIRWILVGRSKSQVYKWENPFKDPKQEFWKYGTKLKNHPNARYRLQFSRVYVPDIEAAKNFYENANKRGNWPYSLPTNNCKHFVLKGLRAGGAQDPLWWDDMKNPYPKKWPLPFDPAMTKLNPLLMPDPQPIKW